MQSKESSFTAFTTLCPILCCQISSTWWRFLNICLHPELLHCALNAEPAGLSGPAWTKSFLLQESQSQQWLNMISPHYLLDSWWFVSIVHTAFSEPAKMWQHQLLEGRSSLVSGIHCQPANTFSEWLKRGAVKSSGISEAVNLDCTLWFSRHLFCFCAKGTLAELHTTDVQHSFGTRHLDTQCCQVHKKSTFRCHVLIPQLSPCRCFTSFSLILAPASGIAAPHHRIAGARGSDLCASSQPSRLRQTPRPGSARKAPDLSWVTGILQRKASAPGQRFL